MSDNAFEDIGGGALAIQQPQVAPTAVAHTDQSRAVAEVQAALVIAQSRPRNEVMARERITQACQRASLAQVAVYAFPRGGQQVSGPSVRLAEAAARAWGNMTYGFRELNRSGGGSEVEAFAWDLETNTKAIRQFGVKHWRDTKSGGHALKDERDIYEMVANQAQRRVRACILEIIPGDVIEDAVKQCEKTLSAAVAGKNGKPMGDVVKDMLLAYEGMGVPKSAIEKRIGHRTDSIQPAEVLRLREIFASIKDGFSSPEEWFEIEDAAADGERTADILDRAKQPAGEPAPKPPRVTQSMREEAAAALAQAGVSIEAVEKEFNTYAPSWSYAQCQEALSRAAAVTGEVKDAEPATVECPDRGASVQATECEACTMRQGCPAHDS